MNPRLSLDQGVNMDTTLKNNVKVEPESLFMVRTKRKIEKTNRRYSTAKRAATVDATRQNKRKGMVK